MLLEAMSKIPAPAPFLTWLLINDLRMQMPVQLSMFYLPAIPNLTFTCLVRSRPSSAYSNTWVLRSNTSK